jgi:hypothetical protein
VADAAVSSASGFALSIAAVALLDEGSLGVYAVFFTAYSFAMALPTELAFTPAEIKAIGLPAHLRVALLRSSLRSGALLALAGAVLTLLSIPVTVGHVPVSSVTALAVSTFAAAVFGPVEEHIRKVLHVAGRSGSALVASVVMLITAAGSAIGLALSDIPPVWVPMTALAVANVASIVAGLWVSRRDLGYWIPADDFRLKALVSVGRYTFVAGFVPSASAFVASAMVTWLAGAEALGYAEAARSVAQPILVLGVGLLRVLGPLSMESGRDADREAARRHARLFRGLMVAGTAGYLVVVAFPWALNPITYLQGYDKAYTIPWLVVVVTLGNLMIGWGLPERSELFGAGRERKVAGMELAATSITLLTAATAAWTQAFARPLARLTSFVFRAVAYRMMAVDIYRADRPANDGTVVEAVAEPT